MVKNPPVMQQTQVQSLGWEDPGKAIHSSILAWRISWTEEPGRLQSLGMQSQTRLKQLSMHAKAILIIIIGTECSFYCWFIRTMFLKLHCSPRNKISATFYKGSEMNTVNS